MHLSHWPKTDAAEDAQAQEQAAGFGDGSAAQFAGRSGAAGGAARAQNGDDGRRGRADDPRAALQIGHRAAAGLQPPRGRRAAAGGGEIRLQEQGRRRAGRPHAVRVQLRDQDVPGGHDHRGGPQADHPRRALRARRHDGRGARPVAGDAGGTVVYRDRQILEDPQNRASHTRPTSRRAVEEPRRADVVGAEAGHLGVRAAHVLAEGLLRLGVLLDDRLPLLVGEERAPRRA